MPDVISRVRRPRASTRGIALLTAATVAAASFGCAVVLAAPAAAAAPTVADIAITATSANDPGGMVAIGDTFSVDIAATSATDLFAYEVIVSFDREKLALVEDSPVYPEGGFGAVSAASDLAAGVVSFTGSRLGTSPGLEGDHTLVAFDLTAVGSGTADIAIETVTLVGSTAEALVVDAPAAISVEISADPVPTASPNPTASAPATSTPTSAPLPSPSSTGPPLAATGADATPWMIGAALALALIALGAALVIRRRAVRQ